MATESPDDPRFAEVDQILSIWRQGDCVLGEHLFVHVADTHMPLSDIDPGGAQAEVEVVETPVRGLVVVTQTCDIVRPCRKRPYLEVCPLVEVEEAMLHEIGRGRYPAYAFLPLLARQRLVADLDRVMTIEKPVAAKWSRIPGWSGDREGREFAQCLARKRVRFAFPDDFSRLAKKLVDRLKSKHDKDSQEGRALKALREIRVQAAPSWEADPVSITFWFVASDQDNDFEGTEWATFVDKWLKLVPETERFTRVDGQVLFLEDITAADYVASDPLDLDPLSAGRE